jgi:hypothetical protein
MSMSRRRVVFGVVLLSVVAIVVVGIALASDEPAGVNCAEFRFDATAWQATDRRSQGDGLDRCRVLIGKTRAEVRAMLGAPDDRDANGIAYDIGPDPLGIDDMYLDVRFTGGTVSDTSIYQG